MPTIELPPVTDAHRRAAFALFHWPDVSFEQALKRLAAHDLDD